MIAEIDIIINNKLLNFGYWGSRFDGGKYKASR